MQNNGQDNNQIANVLIWGFVVLAAILFFWYRSSTNNQKIAQERQNCIGQSQGNIMISNPAQYCSNLTSSDLNQSYPITSN